MNNVTERINKAIADHETFFISARGSILSLSIEIESKNVEAFDYNSIVFYIPENDVNLEFFLDDTLYEEEDDWIIKEGKNNFIISFK